MSVPASEKRRDTQRKKVSVLENFMTREAKIYFSGFFELKKKKKKRHIFMQEGKLKDLMMLF